MEPWMLGAGGGAILGWLILVILGPGGHFEAPNIWVWDEDSRLGCLGQILVMALCVGAGAVAAQMAAG